MPSPPSRRRFLAGASASVAAAVAGCLAGDSRNDGGETTTDETTETTADGLTTDSTKTDREVTADGVYADTKSGPKAYPERPSSVTKSSVLDYVESFERARTYNALYRDDVEEISVDATVSHDVAAHGGHYALATGSGWANYADGLHADWGQAPALFFVDDQLTVRVGRYESYYDDCQEVFASDDPAENFAEVCEGGDAAIRVYNCHPDAHDVSLELAFRDDDGSPTIFEDEYFLGTTDAIKQESLTYRKGTYEITATLDGEVTATYDWTLESERAYDDPALTVLVEPTGGLTIRKVPYHAV